MDVRWNDCYGWMGLNGCMDQLWMLEEGQYDWMGLNVCVDQLWMLDGMTAMVGWG